MNGTEVSTVNSDVSVEIWRRRAVTANGCRRLLDREESRDSAISAVGLPQSLLCGMRSPEKKGECFLSDLKERKKRIKSEEENIKRFVNVFSYCKRAFSNYNASLSIFSLLTKRLRCQMEGSQFDWQRCITVYSSGHTFLSV